MPTMPDDLGDRSIQHWMQCQKTYLNVDLSRSLQTAYQ